MKELMKGYILLKNNTEQEDRNGWFFKKKKKQTCVCVRKTEREGGGNSSNFAITQNIFGFLFGNNIHKNILRRDLMKVFGYR